MSRWSLCSKAQIFTWVARCSSLSLARVVLLVLVLLVLVLRVLGWSPSFPPPSSPPPKDVSKPAAAAAAAASGPRASVSRASAPQASVPQSPEPGAADSHRFPESCVASQLLGPYGPHQAQIASQRLRPEASPRPKDPALKRGSEVSDL